MNNKRQDTDKVGEDAERYLPYVPCYKLTAIAAPLLNHLTALSQVIKEQREELNSLRKEVNKVCFFDEKSIFIRGFIVNS